MYVQKRVKAQGYATELVSGITSFCAAAARMNISLGEWNERIHIIPAVHRLDEPLDLPGNYVLMKSGRKMNQVKEVSLPCIMLYKLSIQFRFPVLFATGLWIITKGR